MCRNTVCCRSSLLQKGLVAAIDQADGLEILSSAQSQTKVTGNLLPCLRHGSQLGWLLDPHERSVLVYQPDRLPEMLLGVDRLPLDEAALQLSVDTVYGWLQWTG